MLERVDQCGPFFVVCEWGSPLRRLVHVGCQELWNFLTALHQNLGQLRSDGQILIVVERRGLADVSHTSGASDSVNIFVNIVAEVIVNDMHHVLDVQPARGYSGGNEDRTSTIPKQTSA